MYKPIFVIAFLCLIFLGCSKEEEREPVPQMIEEATGLDLIEERYGVVIPDKESLTDIDIRPSRTIITINAIQKDVRVAFIVDTLQGKIISNFTFNGDPIRAKLPYGETEQIEYKYLQILEKTDTHLYGHTSYTTGSNSIHPGKALFVGEIESGTIVENDPENNLRLPEFSYPFGFHNWYKGALLIADNDEYRIVGEGNRILKQGRHEKEVYAMYYDFANYSPITMEKAISYKDGTSMIGHFDVYNIETNTRHSISYNPRDNHNDRVEIDSITSDGEKIATVKFKLTTYEGEKNEKTVKVDFVDYKIVE